MTILTTQKILEIHDCVIERYGGTKGVLNTGTIDFLVYLLDKKDDVFERAALALDKIITGHPFVDGHKRTGFQVADLILRERGCHIHASEEEILSTLLKIAEYKCTVEKIKNWIKRKSRPIKEY
ncbi:MAG TPA: type II toxin-antitoxin system death-on-curing family toxin [Candidatus Methanoperedens sp.]